MFLIIFSSSPAGFAVVRAAAPRHGIGETDNEMGPAWTLRVVLLLDLSPFITGTVLLIGGCDCCMVPFQLVGSIKSVEIYAAAAPQKSLISREKAKHLPLPIRLISGLADLHGLPTSAPDRRSAAALQYPMQPSTVENTTHHRAARSIICLPHWRRAAACYRYIASWAKV